MTFRKLLLDNYNSALVITAIIIGIWGGHQGKLSSSGAIVCVVGVFLALRPVITGTGLLLTVIDGETKLNLNSPIYYKKMRVPIPIWVIENEKNKCAVQILSPIVTIIGTLIWALA